MRRLAVRKERNSAVAAAAIVAPEASRSSSAFSIGDRRRSQSVGSSSVKGVLQ
jgi:hypothetical protein